jgi:hypothetical protein
MQQNGGGGMGSSALPILVRDRLFISSFSRKRLSDGKDNEKEGKKKKYE